MNSSPRNLIASLCLSASALVGLISYEGYSDRAIIPIPGDVPTLGFGTTEGVKMGDKTTPQAALARVLVDVRKYEGALSHCVTVPLYQYEYDAYISLSYNIGSNAFCKSTLVALLNAGDYMGACEQILKWDRFKGKPQHGLTLRRQGEYKTCIGENQ